MEQFRAAVEYANNARADPSRDDLFGVVGENGNISNKWENSQICQISAQKARVCHHEDRCENMRAK
jgi:hypothetical protein